jgi:TolB-like protein
MKQIKLVYIFAFFFGMPAFSQTVSSITGQNFKYNPPQNIFANSYTFEPIMTNNSALNSGILNSGIIFMADQIDRNVTSEARTLPTIVSSISDVNNFAETSQFGRLLTEHLIHELQVKNWNIIDARFTKNLIFSSSGEFSLSRDIDKLRASSSNVGNVLTGTYINTNDGIIINLRLINVANGSVLSSAQTRLARDKFLASLIDKPVPLPVLGFSR